MKRHLLIIAIFLLAGAVMNVAVAWALALCIHLEGNRANPTRRGFSVARSHRALPEHRAAGPTHWQVRRLERTGTVLAVVKVVAHPGKLGDMPFEELLPPVRGLAEEIRLIEESSLLSWDTRPGYFLWDGRGWPCISMSCRWPWWQLSMWPRVPIEDGFRFGSPTDAFPWPYGVHQLRGLPLRPIWPGFALNTLFYATLLWLLLLGLSALRRFLRLRRGQQDAARQLPHRSAGLEGGLRCRKCGYDLRGSVVQCSECGESVEQSIAAAYAELKARRTRPLLIGVGIATGVILPLLNLLLIFVSGIAAFGSFDTEVSSYFFWPLECSGWAALFWLTASLTWLIVVLSSWARRRDLRARIVISFFPLAAAICCLRINLWLWMIGRI